MPEKLNRTPDCQILASRNYSRKSVRWGVNIFVELHPVYAAKLEQVKQSGNLPALFEQWIMGLEEEDFSVEIRRTKTKNIERYQGEVIGWQVLVGQHTRPEYAAKLEQVKQSGNLPALFEQWIMALQDDSFSH